MALRPRLVPDLSVLIRQPASKCCSVVSCCYEATAATMAFAQTVFLDTYHKGQPERNDACAGQQDFQAKALAPKERAAGRVRPRTPRPLTKRARLRTPPLRWPSAAIED